MANYCCGRIRELADLSGGTISLGNYRGVDFCNPYSDREDMQYIDPATNGAVDYGMLDAEALEGVEFATDGSEVAGRASKYIRDILKALNSKLLKESGVKLKYRDLKISRMGWDEAAVPFMDEFGRESYVLGYYDTRTNGVRLNPYILENERLLRKVLKHEVVHYAQDKLGIIGSCIEDYGERGARGLIEGQADEVTAELERELCGSESMDSLGLNGPGRERAWN